MIIKTAEELAAMQEIGKICAVTLKKMGEALAPGITTKELDQYGAELLASYGAVSAPIACYQFPGYTCISVNDTVAHGIPGDIVIQPGDIVNIDVSAMKGGFFGDNGASFAVPPVKHILEKLLAAGQEALELAIDAARAGYPLSGIGLAVEKCAKRHGYTTIRNLFGHGVGRTLHDAPDNIYNYHEKRDKRLLEQGLVLAIEPFVSMGDRFVVDAGGDKWTLKTPRRHQVVQFEYTVMVRENQPPLVLTLAE
jgi:methionyl aminopeptidase